MKEHTYEYHTSYKYGKSFGGAETHGNGGDGAVIRHDAGPDGLPHGRGKV
jgi:hypothetical protein